MKNFLCFLVLSLLFFSCSRQDNYIASDKTTLHIDQSDTELERIARDARDTLPVFFRHMLRPAQDEGNFRVKYPIRADRESGFGMEQLWLSDIRYADGMYYGVVDNTPFYTASIKKGDTVAFSAEDITDWMYTSSEKIIGGRSIKYLLEQLPEHSAEQQRIMQMLSDTPAPASMPDEVN
jgi:uncharacterized protein YegJ (DUF2314 family)